MKSNLDKKKQKELIKQAVNLTPLVTIGKNGLNEGQIEGIKAHLKDKRLIKVKILRSYLYSHTIKDTVIELERLISGCQVLQTKGHTIVLYK